MFIGHFAVGFASKRIAPRVSLAPLVAAPLLLDLLWPVFLLLGVEQVSVNPPGGNPFLALRFTLYRWSHSLLMSVVSPPPPSVTALGWTAIGGSIMTLCLAWWIDRHRTEREQRAQSRGLA